MLNKSFLGISLFTILACFSCQKENMHPLNNQDSKKTVQTNQSYRSTHLPAPTPCIPNIGSLQYFHIENFSLGNYSHNSAQEGYSLNNTNLNLEVGETYSISVDYHSHNTSDVLGINVWLDTNSDGVFSSDELIKAVGMGARPSATTPTEIDFDITIPALPTGEIALNTTCRVMLYYKGNAVPNTKGDNPCIIESGEVQDYSVNLYIDESGAFGPRFRNGFPYAPSNVCIPTQHALQYSHIEEFSIDLSFATFTDIQPNNQGYTLGSGTLDYGDRVLNHASFIPVKRGDTYNTSLKYWNHSPIDVLGFRVWIDWNRNNVFEANEVITSEVIPAGTTPFDTNFSLAIPSTASFGPFAMRTMLYYHGNAYPNTKGDNPCIFESGEVTDYTVFVAG